MIILLLAYSIIQSTFGEAGPIPLIQEREVSSCSNQGNGRSMYGIIWSCLSTIFLCTWVTVHPNIVVRPEKRDSNWFGRWIWNPLNDFISSKVPLFILALLIPEYILAWAIRQYIQAGVFKKQVPGWTRTHGFFMIMGGFHLFRLPEGTSSIPLPLDSPSDFVLPSGKHAREDDTPLHPLQMETLPLNVLELISPTETELRDRSKSDGLTKLIVLIQTAWFVIQCIARGVQHLPLTELEIVTVAYAMMNFFIYVFWWDKPRNVECPIRVYNASNTQQKENRLDWSNNKIYEYIFIYVIGEQDNYTDVSRESSVPMFWSGKLEGGFLGHASLGPSILGAAFGAIHCIAWWYEFPSHAELVLWRVSCIAMIGVPLIATVICGLLITDARGDWAFIFALLISIALSVSAWLYIAGRIATLVIAFTTLRSLPPAAFSVVDWTTFIPHI